MARRSYIATCLISCAFMPGVGRAEGTLPADATVVHGDIGISTPSDVQMLVQQSGQAGIIDWGSFSIGQGASVDFQNGSGATLNRVTGSDLTSIMGSLTATGSVYVINPNGIIIGETGQVNTGGRFVASTLDLGNADFLNGGDNVFAGGSAATVINLGRISSLGGDVSLMARQVVNEGTISAPNGTVGLVAGREILMRDASVADGMFSVRIGGSDTSVTDSGSIAAAAAELRANGGNVYALAGNTKGTIAATGVARVDGRVFLTAGNGGTVRVTKGVKATSANGSGGRIDVGGGTVDMAGTLDASGTTGGTVIINSSVQTLFSGTVLAFGDGVPKSGGFVEVSGRQLTFAGTVQTGGGTVLIDPDNIQITEVSSPLLLDGASEILVSDLATLLATQEVIVQTTGLDGEAGTILIGADLFYESDFALTLLAHGDIVATHSIQNSGSGDLNLVAGWGGTTSTVAFDPTPFDTADLATQTLFGNATGDGYILDGGVFAAQGSVVIGGGDVFNPVAIGSADGTTRVYSRDLAINGSDDLNDSFGPAQLGFTVSSMFLASVTGAISVRATGDVTLSGGVNGNGSAQIGHVGNDGFGFGTSVDVIAPITIEALGDMTLLGGSGSNAYAMVGHGTFGSSLPGGTRQGDIILELGGELSLDDSGFGPMYFGHQGQTVADVSNADIRITAAALDTSATTSVASGDLGSFDLILWSEVLQGGDITMTLTDSGLLLLDSQFDFCCSGLNTPNNLVIQVANDIVLDPSFTFANAGGGSVALVAGQNFANNTGGAGFGDMGTGVWVVYSTRPDLNTNDIGVMDADIIGWSTVFDPANPFTGSGLFASGLNYYVTPLITVGDITTVYGAPISPILSVTVDGVVIDPAVFGFAVTPAFIDSALVTFSPDGFINRGSYANALTADNSSTVAAGHRGITTDSGTLQVDAAPLFVGLTDLTKAYDGIAYTAPVTYSGFVGSDTESLITTGPTFVFSGGDGSGRNAGTYVVGAVGFAESSGNYDFIVSDPADLVITPLALSAALTGPITRVYDGTTTATLTPGNFALTGFVSGEGASVTETAGTYASPNASTSTLVTATLTAADFAANAGTQLSNYVLPLSAIGTGSIDPALLTVAITGNPTRTYDGTTTATLTPGNFALTGFVSGEGASVTETAGTYASPNASASALVSATLTAADFAANVGTQLSNYVLPLSAFGTGSIDPALLTVAIIGNPTKVFDGTDLATLTATNFQITGFVSGEGATINQTNGTYASSAVGTGIGVTASLAAGNVDPGTGTLLSNYILPPSASGTGSITAPAPVTPPDPVNPFVPDQSTASVQETRGLDPFSTTTLGITTGPTDSLELISTETTQRIIDEINEGVGFCKQLLSEEYLVDCLSDRLAVVADGLSATGEYAEVRAALDDAARQLRALALSNAGTLPLAVHRASGRSSSRSLTAVSGATLASVNAQAAAIIENTQLVLLRSGENSERRRDAYERISAVVDSTKVLLRSS